MPLPKAAIEQACGTYMTSSIAWMIGLAITEGFSTIGVYGVDMAQQTEYEEQRPCCEYLIGLARGRGIEVRLPRTTDLLRAVGQYGFWSESSELGAKVGERITWLRKEHATTSEKLTNLEAEYQTTLGKLNAQYQGIKDGLVTALRSQEGAIDDCEFWRRWIAIKPAMAPGASPTPDRSKNPNINLVPLPAYAQSGDNK